MMLMEAVQEPGVASWVLLGFMIFVGIVLFILVFFAFYNKHDSY
jgi:uncharacterized membrane protein YqiK